MIRSVRPGNPRYVTRCVGVALGLLGVGAQLLPMPVPLGPAPEEPTRGGSGVDWGAVYGRPVEPNPQQATRPPSLPRPRQWAAWRAMWERIHFNAKLELVAQKRGLTPEQVAAWRAGARVIGYQQAAKDLWAWDFCMDAPNGWRAQPMTVPGLGLGVVDAVRTPYLYTQIRRWAGVDDARRLSVGLAVIPLVVPGGSWQGWLGNATTMTNSGWTTSASTTTTVGGGGESAVVRPIVASHQAVWALSTAAIWAGLTAADQTIIQQHCPSTVYLGCIAAHANGIGSCKLSIAGSTWSEQSGLDHNTGVGWAFWWSTSCSGVSYNGPAEARFEALPATDGVSTIIQRGYAIDNFNLSAANEYEGEPFIINYRGDLTQDTASVDVGDGGGSVTISAWWPLFVIVAAVGAGGADATGHVSPYPLGAIPSGLDASGTAPTGATAFLTHHSAMRACQSFREAATNVIVTNHRGLGSAQPGLGLGAEFQRADSCVLFIDDTVPTFGGAGTSATRTFTDYEWCTTTRAPYIGAATGCVFVANNGTVGMNTHLLRVHGCAFAYAATSIMRQSQAGSYGPSYDDNAASRAAGDDDYHVKLWVDSTVHYSTTVEDGGLEFNSKGTWAAFTQVFVTDATFTDRLTAIPGGLQVQLIRGCVAANMGKNWVNAMPKCAYDCDANNVSAERWGGGGSSPHEDVIQGGSTEAAAAGVAATFTERNRIGLDIRNYWTHGQTRYYSSQGPTTFPTSGGNVGRGVRDFAMLNSVFVTETNPEHLMGVDARNDIIQHCTIMGNAGAGNSVAWSDNRGAGEEETGTLAGVTSTTVLTVTANDAPFDSDSGSHEGTQLLVNNGAAAGDKRTVASYVVAVGVGTITLTSALSALPSAGDSITIGTIPRSHTQIHVQCTLCYKINLYSTGSAFTGTISYCRVLSTVTATGLTQTGVNTGGTLTDYFVDPDTVLTTDGAASQAITSTADWTPVAAIDRIAAGYVRWDYPNNAGASTGARADNGQDAIGAFALELVPITGGVEVGTWRWGEAEATEAWIRAVGLSRDLAPLGEGLPDDSADPTPGDFGRLCRTRRQERVLREQSR